jgi:hypothetical protein
MIAGEIVFVFEELPLGEEISNGFVWTFEARAWGRALVEYSGDGDWAVSDIEIATTREIAGPGGARRWVDGYAWLDRKSHLYTLIAIALLKRESEQIECKIIAALEADGMTLGNPNEEHRLGAQQLGLGRYA